MSFDINTFVNRAGVAALPRLFRAADGDSSQTVRGKRLFAGLVGLALIGALAAALAFWKGHAVMGTTSEVSWGILIATYVFLVVSSTGLGLVSSLGHVFGYRVFEPVAKKAMWLALVTLVIGFSVIASELERPFLLLKLVILSPNPRSPIWWMGMLYGTYLGIIIAELYFLLSGNHKWSRIGGIVTVVAALTVHPTSNLGAVFGLSHARAYWYGPLLPIYMISSALVCGAALLILIVYFGDYFGGAPKLRAENAPLVGALRKLLALFIGISVFITVWKLIVGVQGDHYHKYDVTMAMLTGPLFVSFWLFEVFIGVVVPLAIVLSARGRSAGWVALAAVATMVGVFVSRINMVYAGQMFSLKPVVGRMGEVLRYSPPFKGSPAGFLPYTPSIVEVLIVAGAIAAAIVLYVVGTRALRLAKEA